MLTIDDETARSALAALAFAPAQEFNPSDFTEEGADSDAGDGG